MAVAIPRSLSQQPPAVITNRVPPGLIMLLLAYFGFLPFADVFAGLLATLYEITWFAIAYKMGAIFLVAIFLLAGQIRSVYSLVALIVIVLLIASAGLRQSWGYGGLSDDLLYIARGPILLSCVLVVLIALTRRDVQKIAKTYFIFTWLVTAGSILSTYWLGISLTTYDAGYGARGFYQAANEVTLSFVLSWWYLQVRVVRSPFQAGVLLLATCYVIYTVGTKSGFVLIPILCLWYLGRWLKLRRITNLTLFLGISLVVSIFAGSIFLAVLPYLPSADASVFFISTYGVDTTLTGGRFVELDEIIGEIRNFNIIELIFGTGFHNFWFSIDGYSVESDLIDTLGGGGILFAGWFYGVLIWGYKCSKAWSPRNIKIDTAWAFVFIAVIMYSIFVGHVAFAATPLITVGVYLALAYKEQVLEGPTRTLLVQ